MSTDPRVGLLLALADDELILGHRLSEWTGWVPYIEEDLAMSSIAQDEMAHARTLYQIVEQIDGRDVDLLALGREPREYRNAVICERPNRDFAFTLARHWLYDTADDVRLRALASTPFKELREAVDLILLEERYHLDHANAWFSRLANGPVEARHRFADALTETFAEAMAVFEPFEGEEALLADGVLPRASEDLLAGWLQVVGDRLEQEGLSQVLGAQEQGAGEMVPTSTGEMQPGEAGARAVPGLARADGRWTHEGAFAPGGRRGEHSEDFEPMWAEMTALYRAHPGARW